MLLPLLISWPCPLDRCNRQTGWLGAFVTQVGRVMPLPQLLKQATAGQIGYKQAQIGYKQTLQALILCCVAFTSTLYTELQRLSTSLNGPRSELLVIAAFILYRFHL